MDAAAERVMTLFPGIARAPFSTGVLPYQHIRGLIQNKLVTAQEPFADDQVQPASLDLRLGAVAHRLQASFLPGAHWKVADKLQALSMARLDLASPTVLEKGCVYLAPLLESLRLPEGMSARANPKSTTGRLDVFTRLITDNGREFERVPDRYSGPLFAEIVPRTFSVIVQKGARLSQLRFVRGKPLPSDSQLERLDEQEKLIYLDEESPARADIRDGLRLSINLRSEDPREVVAYRGRKNAPLIDVGKVEHYEPEEFWDRITSRRDGRLILHPGDFYILGSLERVRVPPDYAAEMVPFDPSVGEFRIHYAGFFDPGFGYGHSDIRGTRAVLEVRAHEVPFMIEHGQVVSRLRYSRLREVPDKIYGASIGSSYQRQGLALSKQFRRRAARADAAGGGEGAPALAGGG
jgi:dCTP deaminase